MSFNPSESAIKIDKAEHTEGLNAAYDLFTKEINTIKQVNSPEEANAQIKSLTDDLSKRGVLPDLAVRWGKEERGMIADDGTFTKRELATYRSANKEDALVASMTTSLINRYSQLESRNGDWFGDGVSEGDLEQSLSDIDNRLAKTVQNKESQAVAEKLNAQDGRLFKQIAGTSNDKAQITPYDLTTLLSSDDLAKGYSGKDGVGFLSKEDRAMIEQMKKDWNKPYMQAMMPNNSSMSLDAVAKSAKIEIPNYEVSSNTAGAAIGEVAAAAISGGGGNIGGTLGDAVAVAAVGDTADNGAETAPVEAIPAPVEKQTYTVRSGQGFDRVARDILRSHEGEYSEAEVIALSAQIAEVNGMNRNSSVVRDGMVLEIPALAS